jgi:hypothetical protein
MLLMSSAPETTYELLVEGARSALDLQRDDGSFPPGRAGAYDYALTPVRKTGSWLFTLTKAYELTSEQSFRTAASRAVDYLLSDTSRPNGYTFSARNVANKDRCDGLVGQAAPIRGLSYAGQVFEREDALTAAREVFKLHPFHERLGLWKRVDIDGTQLSFDRTLNHQLIFAASAIPLVDCFDSVQSTCSTFLDRLDKNIGLHDDGLPRHYVRPPLRDVLPAVISIPNNWSLLWNEFTIHYHAMSEHRRRKEIGYFPVITAQLAQLRSAWPDHEVWNSTKLSQLLSFLESAVYEEALNENIKYGAVMPRLDHAITVWNFDDPSHEELRRLLNEALANSYDTNSGLFVENTEDSAFQASGVSKLAHLPKIRLAVGDYSNTERQ